jgi:DNA-binding MarR family transcriptional regulator
MIAKGRGQKGEKQGASKLTETQVREIRTLYANGGISQRELGVKYGVSQPAIGKLITGENWSHI